MIPTDLTEHSVAEVHAVTSADPSRVQTDTKVYHVRVFIKTGHPRLRTGAEEPDDTVCGGVGYCRITICGSEQPVGSGQVIDLPRTAVSPAGHLMGVTDSQRTCYQAVRPCLVHSVMVSQPPAIIEAVFGLNMTLSGIGGLQQRPDRRRQHQDQTDQATNVWQGQFSATSAPHPARITRAPPEVSQSRRPDSPRHHEFNRCN